MMPIGLIALGIVVAVLVFAFALCNIAADDKGDDDYDRIEAVPVLRRETCC